MSAFVDRLRVLVEEEVDSRHPVRYEGDDGFIRNEIDRELEEMAEEFFNWFKERKKG